MAVEMRELYSSPNGDRWYLARDVGLGQVFVRHEPNLPSGGQAAHIEVGAFLHRGGQGPEHRELLWLIGTLVERDRSFEHGTATRIKSHAKSHIVELTDGSKWRIWPGDLATTLGWTPEAEIDPVPLVWPGSHRAFLAFQTGLHRADAGGTRRVAPGLCHAGPADSPGIRAGC
jgi:hypothetical protein